MATQEQLGNSRSREQRAATYIAGVAMRVAQTSPSEAKNLEVRAEVASLIEQAAAGREPDANASIPQVLPQKGLCQ